MRVSVVFKVNPLLIGEVGRILAGKLCLGQRRTERIQHDIGRGRKTAKRGGIPLRHQRQKPPDLRQR